MLKRSARVTLKKATGEEETLDTAKADIFMANEKGLMTNDHCALIHLNEPCVLENTKLRYTCALRAARRARAPPAAFSRAGAHFLIHRLTRAN